MEREIIKNTLYIIVGGLCSSGLLLIDQMFMGHLGDEFLKIHILLSFIPFTLSFLGKVFGHAYLIVGSKEDHWMKSALTLYGLVGVFAVVFWIISRNYYFNWYLINKPLTWHYSLFILMTSLLIFFSTIQNYFLVSDNRGTWVTMGNGSLLILNVLGNTVSFMLFSDPSYRLMSCGLSSNLALLFSLAIRMIPLKRSVNDCEELHLVGYFKRCRHILGGDLITALMTLLSPFLVTTLFTLYGQDHLIAPYAISEQISHFFTIPALALMVYGVAHTSKISEPSQLEKTQSSFKKVLIKICLLPCVLGFLILWQSQGAPWGLSEKSDFYFLFGASAKAFPLILSTLSLIKLRRLEKQRALAKMDFFIQILFLGVLALCFATKNHSPYLLSAIVVLITVGKTFALKKMCMKA